MSQLKLNILPVFAAMLMLFHASCEFDDTENATIPSYLCIPSYTFNADSSAANYQGTSTTYFTDMWVTETGNLVGATGLPLLLPIQKSGASKVSIDAGIMVSGQDDKRSAYPFSATYNENITLEAGQIDTIRPVFRYLNNTKFKFIVDYELPQSSRGFELNHNYVAAGDTFMGVADDQSSTPGNKYLKVNVKANSTSFQMVTTDEYVLPNLGAPVYLELDYKSDAQLQIGYYYQEPNQPTSGANPVIDLFPSDQWKKIYLNLSQETSSRKTGTLYRIYIGFYNNSGIAPKIALDNIKLLTLE